MVLIVTTVLTLDKSSFTFLFTFSYQQKASYLRVVLSECLKGKNRNVVNAKNFALMEAVWMHHSVQ